MRQILKADHEQLLMLPPCMDEWIGPEHPARFVQAFVTSLDLKRLGLDEANREQGGWIYAPELLLAVWLYGYFRKIRSTRALEKACQEEMGFVWLSGNHRPDHNALWRFWSEHREGLRNVFKESVQVAGQMGLVGLVVQAIDGTKIAAAGSSRGTFDKASLEKLLARLDTQIRAREQDIERGEAEVSSGLPPELQGMKVLQEKIKAALDRIDGGESKYAHPNDPQSARMEVSGQNRFAYNAQAVVDAKQQIVVASDVCNEPNDHGQLRDMAVQAKEECGQAQAYLADGGYCNAGQHQKAAQEGLNVVSALAAGWGKNDHEYHASNFRHDPSRNVVVCPQGRELAYKGLRQKETVLVALYKGGQVCKGCAVRKRCTGDAHGRLIERPEGYDQLVRLKRKWKAPQTESLYAWRARTVEPVFAHIKHVMGFRRWTVRGVEKVKTQWSLLCAVHNLKVIWRNLCSKPNDEQPSLHDQLPELIAKVSAI